MEVLLLGPLRVRVDGVEHPIPAAQQRTLLARLAVVAGQRVSVEELVDAVWPEDPPATASKGLHVLVDRLRTPNAAELDNLLVRMRVAAVIGGALVIAAAIWLGVFVHPAWYLFGILGLLLLLFTWRYGGPDSDAEATAIQYLRMGTLLARRNWMDAASGHGSRHKGPDCSGPSLRV